MNRLRSLLIAFALSWSVSAQATNHFFSIRVVDADGGLVDGGPSPLPGATVTTVNNISLVADNNGLVAFYEPGLMGQSVYFDVARPGYQHAADGFGYQGVELTASEGGAATVALFHVSDGGPVGSHGTSATQLLSNGAAVPARAKIFKITVVDDQTGRGIPLAEVHSATEVDITDSHGEVAFYDPALLGQSVPFTVIAHGYEASDGGSSQSLVATAGGSGVLSLHSVNIAERMYRITGGGIYRDSLLLGESVPLADPVIDGMVLGQDSSQTAIYHGQIFWIWGDTNRPGYPLGNFDTSSAISQLPDAGGLLPEVGVDLTYFTDATGFVKGMVDPTNIPGGGPVWLDGLVTVQSEDGGEALFAGYAKVITLGTTSETGKVRFDDVSQTFKKVFSYSTTNLVQPQGGALSLTVDGTPWVYFQNTTRVPGTAAGMSDPSTYESFTPFAPGTTDTIDRSADGGVNYDWKIGTPPLVSNNADGGPLPSEERLYGHMRDAALGTSIAISSGSTQWNPYRGRFTGIIGQSFGSTSLDGELWYAESDTPLGTWVDARKVITHNDYSFYNPSQHPYFAENGGRTLFFEGTYTASFSGAPVQTPRYDYNQVMYRLDLDDPRLLLPVPVYDLSGQGTGELLGTKHRVRPGMSWLSAPFLAPDRPMPQTVPISWTAPACAGGRLVAGGTPVSEPLFYALPPDASSPPNTTAAFYEFTNTNGDRRYGLAGTSMPGFTQAALPLALVWTNPISVPLPVASYLPAVVASAGPDQCVVESSPGEGAVVTLDGSQSSDSAGVINSYQWSWDAGGSATGATASVTLSTGLHEIQLTVTGSDGATSTATLMVNVAPGGASSSTASSSSGSGAGSSSGSGTGSTSSSSGAGSAGATSGSAPASSASGCGCSGSGADGATLLALGLVAALRRRSRVG